MTDVSILDKFKRNWLRFTARVLMICWIGFWGFFIVASILSEPFQIGGLIPIAIFLILFVIPVIIAWRWESFGGILLIPIGLSILIGYPLLANEPLTTVIMVYLTMAIPPIIAGLLLVIRKRQSINL